MISVQDFRTVFPRCTDPEGWVSAMEAAFPEYEINTPERCAAFIAQCGHECGGWTVFQENLNYSAQGLVGTFRKYFPTIESAQPYARQPERIANKVYCNRNGNGSEASGEGWKYRGRGPIQLTGKSNYTNFANQFCSNPEEIVDNPDLVANDKDISLRSAIWFWNTNGLNQYADSGDLDTMTRRINGGFNGLEDRKHLYSQLIQYT